jgi:hypothetical protein
MGLIPGSAREKCAIFGSNFSMELTNSTLAAQIGS